MEQVLVIGSSNYGSCTGQYKWFPAVQPKLLFKDGLAWQILKETGTEECGADLAQLSACHQWSQRQLPSL